MSRKNRSSTKAYFNNAQDHGILHYMSFVNCVPALLIIVLTKKKRFVILTFLVKEFSKQIQCRYGRSLPEMAMNNYNCQRTTVLLETNLLNHFLFVESSVAFSIYF